jgi:hypothetical protein
VIPSDGFFLADGAERGCYTMMIRSLLGCFSFSDAIGIPGGPVSPICSGLSANSAGQSGRWPHSSVFAIKVGPGFFSEKWCCRDAKLLANGSILTCLEVPECVTIVAANGASKTIANGSIRQVCTAWKIEVFRESAHPSVRPCF